jgi:hypothetical protein
MLAAGDSDGKVVQRRRRGGLLVNSRATPPETMCGAFVAEEGGRSCTSGGRSLWRALERGADRGKLVGDLTSPQIGIGAGRGLRTSSSGPSACGAF